MSFSRSRSPCWTNANHHLVQSHLSSQRAAVKMLHDRIVLLVKYVADILAGAFASCRWIAYFANNHVCIQGKRPKIIQRSALSRLLSRPYPQVTTRGSERSLTLYVASLCSCREAAVPDTSFLGIRGRPTYGISVCADQVRQSTERRTSLYLSLDHND